jgi:hypothetical protein
MKSRRLEDNRIRKVVDYGFILKDYFSIQWFHEWLQEIYNNDDI